MKPMNIKSQRQRQKQKHRTSGTLSLSLSASLPLSLRLWISYLSLRRLRILLLECLGLCFVLSLFCKLLKYRGEAPMGCFRCTGESSKKSEHQNNNYSKKDNKLDDGAASGNAANLFVRSFFTKQGDEMSTISFFWFLYMVYI